MFEITLKELRSMIEKQYKKRPAKLKLNGLDLSGLDLSDLDFHGIPVDFSESKFVGSILRIIEFNHSNFNGADFSNASIRQVDFIGSDLSNANFQCANIAYTGFYHSNLTDAIFTAANIHKVNFYYTDLKGSDFKVAAMSGSDLFLAKNVPSIPMVPPESGSFIGWKKARGHIVKLLIPANAKRSSATSRKCRCDRAKVLEIQNLEGKKENIREIRSDRDGKFIYTVGKTVSVPDFNPNRWVECATGIHFFISRQEAVEY